MVRRHAVFLAALLALVLAVFGAAACDDALVAERCSDIPPGGCPLSHGVACEDPACEKVYACRPGNVWELSQSCSGFDGGRSADASALEGSAPPVDASIDAPPGAFGGPGCASLQEPDCSVGLALSCGASCCGCEDLYVCEDGAWSLWGACGDAGVVPGR